METQYLCTPSTPLMSEKHHATRLIASDKPDLSLRGKENSAECVPVRDPPNDRCKQIHLVKTENPPVTISQSALVKKRNTGHQDFLFCLIFKTIKSGVQRCEYRLVTLRGWQEDRRQRLGPSNIKYTNNGTWTTKRETDNQNCVPKKCDGIARECTRAREHSNPLYKIIFTLQHRTDARIQHSYENSVSSRAKLWLATLPNLGRRHISTPQNGRGREESRSNVLRRAYRPLFDPPLPHTATTNKTHPSLPPHSVFSSSIPS